MAVFFAFSPDSPTTPAKSQCLADESIVSWARAPTPSSLSEDKSAAFLLGSLVTRRYEGGTGVAESDAAVLLAALDPGWRTAPWAQVTLPEPFSDFAATRRAIKDAGVIGVLLRTWETWVARPVFGSDSLTWFTSLDAATESVPRGISRQFMIDLYREIAKALPSFACVPPGMPEPLQRHATTLRCQVGSSGRIGDKLQ